LREVFPSDPNQFRVLQYDSCRGLEGWTVVCLHFDEFINYKKETFIDEEEPGQISFESPEEKRKIFAHRWAMIPLTRAIDTIIITINDPESEYAQILRDISLKHPDYIEFI
jgi:hypothetical protein